VSAATGAESMGALLEVHDLEVEYARRTGPVRVLDGVSLTIHPGESLGVVGESGVGKTVLVRAILGLLDPPWRVLGGTVSYRGQNLLAQPEAALRQLRGKEIALTTHEPRKHLNPVATIGDQMARVVQAHRRASRTDARTRAIELLRLVGIPDPELRLQAYPHELSGGMCQRVVIAMALAHSPKLLMGDEPTAGLDVTISLQILDLMRDLVRDFHSSLLLVSRDLGVVAHYCQRVAVMYAGQIVEVADVPTFFADAIHPYSRRLLRAAVAATSDRRGTLSSVGNRAERGAQSCPYAPRCPLCIERCTREAPPLDAVAPARRVRCFRHAEITAGLEAP
jgi:oligopeptide/dipeptide ABC transporter ATP-binding protein